MAFSLSADKLKNINISPMKEMKALNLHMSQHTDSWVWQGQEPVKTSH